MLRMAYWTNKETARNDDGSLEELDRSCAERRWFNARSNGGSDERKERQRLEKDWDIR